MSISARASTPRALRISRGGLSWVVMAWTLVTIASCSREPLPTIRIGINPWPGYEFLYLAVQKGFMAQEGVSVRLIEYESLSDNRRAFERGQVDAMCCTLVEVLQAYDVSKRAAQVVYVTDYSDGADMILAKPDIEGVSGLRGKRVAVELGTLNLYLLARALETAKLTLDDVHLIAHPQSGMPQAFERGDVDAVVIYPPASIAVLRTGKAHVLFSSKDTPREIVDVLAFDANLVARRTDDVARVIRAYHRAFRYAAEKPDDAYPLMAAREGITVEEFRETLNSGTHLVSPGEQGSFLAPGGTLEKNLGAVESVLRRTKTIREAVPPAQSISNKPLERASSS